MKYLVLVVLFSSFALIQVQQKEKIEFTKTLPVVSPLYKDLGVRDTNAIIFTTYSNSYWFDKISTDYLVFQSNEKVVLMRKHVSKNSEIKPKIEKIKIDKSMSPSFREWLDTCVSQGLFNLNQSQLDFNEKPISPGRVSSMIIADGVYYRFAIFHGRKYLSYSSSDPQAFIDEDYPGKEEREKFLKVIDSYYSLTKSFKCKH
jgi:hypothetical protein